MLAILCANSAAFRLKLIDSERGDPEGSVARLGDVTLSELPSARRREPSADNPDRQPGVGAVEVGPGSVGDCRTRAASVFVWVCSSRATSELSLLLEILDGLMAQNLSTS